MQTIKNRAKHLAKLHRQIQNKHPNYVANSSSPTRYEIGGESLRGLEYITDCDMGCNRQCIKDEAILATLQEQKKLLRQQVLESGDEDAKSARTNRNVNMTAIRLARIYREKAEEALRYSKLVAEEDAEVASAILAEDLSPSFKSLADKIEPEHVRDLSTNLPIIDTLHQQCSSDLGMQSNFKVLAPVLLNYCSYI